MSKHAPGLWRVTNVNGTSKDYTVVSVATGGFIAAVSHKPYADLIAKAPIAPKLADALRDVLRLHDNKAEAIKAHEQASAALAEWDAQS